MVGESFHAVELKSIWTRACDCPTRRMSAPLTEILIAVDSILKEAKPEEPNGQSSESKDENGEKKSQADSESEDRFDTRNQQVLSERV